MKRINVLLLIVILSLSSFMVSCSPTKESVTPQSTVSNNTTTDNSDLSQENNELKMENEKLTYENNSLKARNTYLEQNIRELSPSPFENNYTIDMLLQKIFTNNSKVDIFPGRLQSTRVEKIGDETYFIFSIDRMDVNPKWDGPGSDSGKGFFINSEETYNEYKGRISTVFSFQGYENAHKKTEAILADSKYSSNRILNFYMIGDEIVFIGQDPGP